MNAKRKVAMAPRLGIREWCMLEPVSPGKSVPYHCCLCLHCPASLKISKVLWQVLWILWNTIGWRKCPPAIYNIHWLLRELSAIHQWPVGTECCRSAETSCRRQFWQQQKTNSIWHGISGTCEHGHVPHHVLNSGKHGPRFSSHQLCMIAQEIKLAIWCKNACNTQMRTKTLSCLSQGPRWPRVKTRYITYSMNAP